MALLVARAQCRRGHAAPVVGDHQPHVVATRVERHLHRAGRGVAVDVAQRLLGGPVEQLAHVALQLARLEVDVHRDRHAAGAQRLAQLLEGVVQRACAGLGGIEVDEQRAQGADAVAADRGPPAHGRVRVTGARVRRARRHRLQVVGDAGQVLDDAIVQLRGDPSPLRVQRRVGMATEGLALLLLCAHAPGQEPGERKLGQRQGEQQGDHDRQDAAQDAPAAGGDRARPVIGLDDHAAAVGGRDREVHLDERPPAALEAVLRRREVRDLGPHGAVLEGVAQVLGGPEAPPHQLRDIGVGDAAVGRPHLQAHDRVAQHAPAQVGVQLRQGRRVAVERGRRQVGPDHAASERHGERAGVVQRLVRGDVAQPDRSDRRDHGQQNGGRQGELRQRHAPARGAPGHDACDERRRRATAQHAPPARRRRERIGGGGGRGQGPRC